MPIFDPENILIYGEEYQVPSCMEGNCNCYSTSMSRWYIDQWVEPDRLKLVDAEDYSDIVLEELPLYFKWCYIRTKMNPLPVWWEALFLNS